MKAKVYETIKSALESAKIQFDTDGETIWIDDPCGREKTIALGFTECESGDEPAKGEHRYTVSLHVSMGDIVEVTAKDERDAERIVQEKWERGDITLDDLTEHDVQIDCTAQLDHEDDAESGFICPLHQRPCDQECSWGEKANCEFYQGLSAAKVK